MRQYLNKKNVLPIVIIFILIFVVLGIISYRKSGKTSEEDKNISCNDKCLSFGYILGSCRSWAAETDEEVQCGSYEEGIGKTKDCQSETAGVKSECCCRTKESVFSTPTP